MEVNISNISKLDEFDPDNGCWDEYRRKMENYFRQENIGEGFEKRKIFLESCGSKTQLYIQRLFASKDLNSKTYNELVDFITKHQSPQLTSIRARYCFNTHERQEGETLEQFLDMLRKLAEPCAFGESTREMVRDRFICGVGNKHVQELLLSQTELTMEEAFERAQVIETVYQHLDRLEKDKVKSGEQVECQVCGKRLLLSNLKIHYKIHTGERGFSCFVCHKRFTTKGNLKDHEQSHNRYKLHTCTVCNKEFSRLSSLKTHQQLSHAAGTTGTTRTGCSLYSNNKKESKSNVTDSKTIVTKTVSQSKHKVGDSSSPGIICGTCGKTLSSNSSLEIHTRIHTGEKPWKCKKCPKKFTQYASMLRHDVVHTRARSFICPVCSKAFAHNDSLRKHERLHKEDGRPFKCDVCNKRFTQKQALHRHSVTHTREQPYLCDMASCSRRFSHIDALRKHKILHTKEYPYQCGGCGAGFIQSISLRRHMLKKHKLKEMDSDGKEKETSTTIAGKIRPQPVAKSTDIGLKDLFVMKTNVVDKVKGQEAGNHVLFLKCDQGKLLGEDVAIWKPLEVIPEGKRVILPKSNLSNDNSAADLKLPAGIKGTFDSYIKEGSISKAEHGSEHMVGNDQENHNLECTEAIEQRNNSTQTQENEMDSLIKYGNIVIVKGSKRIPSPKGEASRKVNPVHVNLDEISTECQDHHLDSVVTGLKYLSRRLHQQEQQVQPQDQEQQGKPQPLEQQIEKLQQQLRLEIQQQQRQQRQERTSRT